MTKFFDKKREEELGTGEAIHLAAVAAELAARIESSNAIRKAKGMPTLQEEAEELIAEIHRLIADGRATGADYPCRFEDELPDAE